MIAEPPLLVPSAQESPIYVPDVTITLFMRFIGSAGLVKITAPLPSSEGYESPRTFVAMI